LARLSSEAALWHNQPTQINAPGIPLFWAIRAFERGGVGSPPDHKKAGSCDKGSIFPHLFRLIQSPSLRAKNCFRECPAKGPVPLQRNPHPLTSSHPHPSRSCREGLLLRARHLKGLRRPLTEEGSSPPPVSLFSSPCCPILRSTVTSFLAIIVFTEWQKKIKKTRRKPSHEDKKFKRRKNPQTGRLGNKGGKDRHGR